MVRKILLGALLCWPPLACAAPPANPPAPAPSPAATPSDSAQLQEQIRSLDKEVSILKETTVTRFDMQDKRIGDLNVPISQQSNLIGWVSALITLIALISGFVGYFSVKSRAKEQASETAKTEAEAAAKKWLEEHFSTQQERIEALRAEIEEVANTAKQAIQQKQAEVASLTDKLFQAVAERVAKTPDQPGKKPTPPDVADPEIAAAAQKVDQALQEIPEARFTADDYLARGLSEFSANRHEAALLSFDKALALAQTPDFPPEKTARILLARAITFGKLDQPEAEIAAYDDIDSRYGQADSPVLREQVAKALFNKGVTLGQLGRNTDEIAVYEEVDRRYGQDTSLALRVQVAKVLVNKGFTLGLLGNRKDEYATYDEVDRRYGRDEALALRERVVKALFNKGVALGKDNLYREAIAIYDEIDRRYSQSDASALREQVADALRNKGYALGKLSLYNDAIAVFEDIEHRYGQDTSPALCNVVANIRNNLGYNRLLLAKQHWADAPLRTQYLTQAQADLERTSDQSSEALTVMVAGNLGYARFLSGQTEAAEALTRKCLHLGGEQGLRGQRADAQLHRVEPEDSAYEALLDRLWAELHPEAD